jgi:hypothetical protein
MSRKSNLMAHDTSRLPCSYSDLSPSWRHDLISSVSVYFGGVSALTLLFRRTHLPLEPGPQFVPLHDLSGRGRRKRAGSSTSPAAYSTRWGGGFGPLTQSLLGLVQPMMPFLNRCRPAASPPQAVLDGASGCTHRETLVYHRSRARPTSSACHLGETLGGTACTQLMRWHD